MSVQKRFPPVVHTGALPGDSTYRAAEGISELIGGIYDCILDPANWETMLAKINLELGFSSSALGLVPLRGGAMSVNAHVNIDRQWIELGPAYTADAVALWGGAERAEQYPLDEPIVSSQIDTYDARHSNRYYRDVLAPRGLVDSLMLTLARDRSLFGYVAFNRHQPEDLIGEAEVVAMRILAPHFRRAATISNLFDLKAVEASTFASTLDSFAFAVILVDEHLAIVHANTAARTMLASNYPVRSANGVLRLPSPPAHDALARAVRFTAGNEAELGARGIGIPLRHGDGAPAVVHVLPLGRGELGRGLAQRATAALFVTPASAPARAPADALAVLYDLTPAEVRVLELLAAGATQAAIGQTLGIAPSTVKSHVLRLFEKTGRRRQAELVRLVADMSLPV